MQGFQSGPLFSNGAVPPGADPIGLVMAASTGAHTAWVDQRCELVLDVSAPGTAADAYEFQIQESLDLGTTWRTIPVAYGIDSNGIQYQTDGVYRKTTAAAERFYIVVHEQTLIRVQARRVGGAVDTTLLITAQTREPLPRFTPLVPMEQVLDPPLAPYDGGGQAINIGAAATVTTQLAIGVTYVLTAEAPCYVTWGGAAVAATAADYYLIAGFPVKVRIPDAAHSYLSCIRQLTDAAGGFHVCRAEE